MITVDPMDGLVHELRLAADCPSCDGNGWENGNGFSAPATLGLKGRCYFAVHPLVVAGALGLLGPAALMTDTFYTTCKGTSNPRKGEPE
jgi:hypothetical protein